MYIPFFLGSLLQGKHPTSNKLTEKPYQCTECDRKFGTSGKLNTNLRQKHQQFDLSKLRNVPKTSSLPVHEKKKPAKLKNGSKNNILSNSSVEEMGFISDHEETTPLAKFRKCPTKNNILSKSSTDKESSSFLKPIHEETKPLLPHLKPQLCSECGKQFETRDSFNIHLRKKHSIEICEVKKRRKKEYSHNNVKSDESSENSGDVHERKKRKIDFEFSEDYIKSDNSLDINKSDVSTIHEKKKTQGPYKCDICGKDFETLKNLQQSLNAHLRDSHHVSKEDRKQFKLGKQFKLRNENSKKSEKAEKKKLSKPFSCEICGKNLTTNENLVKHMAYAHNGPKPYNCSKCGKKFAIKSNLDEHLKCKKSNCYKGVFEEKSAKVNKNNNIRHKPKTAKPKLAIKNTTEIIEDSAKIHECPKCGKKFEKLMSMKGHVLRSNTCREEILKNPEGLQFTKPVDESLLKYDCIACDRKFGTKMNVRVHIQKKHPKSYEGT